MESKAVMLLLALTVFAQYVAADPTFGTLSLTEQKQDPSSPGLMEGDTFQLEVDATRDPADVASFADAGLAVGYYAVFPGSSSAKLYWLGGANGNAGFNCLFDLTACSSTPPANIDDNRCYCKSNSGNTYSLVFVGKPDDLFSLYGGQVSMLWRKDYSDSTRGIKSMASETGYVESNRVDVPLLCPDVNTINLALSYYIGSLQRYINFALNKCDAATGCVISISASSGTIRGIDIEPVNENVVVTITNPSGVTTTQNGDDIEDMEDIAFSAADLDKTWTWTFQEPVAAGSCARSGGGSFTITSS